MTDQRAALNDIRVLDLSRVLAGPVCTQILGDLGAEIIKIERPARDGDPGGDDTRHWGPPYLQNEAGQDTPESAYYLSANRNKKSVTIDITTSEGQELIHKLIARSDVLIQNFKVGGLDKYGLDYESLAQKYPALIYCHITGFGQNGPLAREPGYDFLAQALGGLMSITGEPDGAPMKAGVALSDIMTGLYSAIGILSALHERTNSHKGQMVDISLLDCTIAGMTNVAQYYLTSGKVAPRQGNAHSTIVPYQSFEARDGYIILAIGNNRQFRRFCDFIGKPEWITDERFATNNARVRHREILVPMIAEIMAARNCDDWIKDLQEIDVPASPVNDMKQVFDMEQVAVNNMKINMNHPLASDPIALVGSPLKMSRTPPAYHRAPPLLGADNQDVLKDILGLDAEQIDQLKQKGIL